MEYYTETGESRQDCMLKIASRVNQPFTIIDTKQVTLKTGFLGLISKPGVEVKWYLNKSYKKPVSYEMPENDLEASKRKIIAAAGKDYDKTMQDSITSSVTSGKEASDQILNALNELKEKIETSTIGNKQEEHPSFVKITNILKLNDFSENYINSMIERMRKELSLEKLEDFDFVQENVVEWIGESISIYKEDEFIRKPRIFILIGPTGIGKTSTIAKLAAYYGIKRDDFSAFDTRMITIDALRICAFEQLEKIGSYMNIPVSFINAEEIEQTKMCLKREIAKYKDIELFFIDTFGVSPNDAVKIGEMKTILDGAGRNAEFHLAINAATNVKDLENILRVFEPFDYKSVIITKTDETKQRGNVISVLAEKRKSISYLTCGQAIPSDIKKASVVDFLINLEGIKINREKIEKRFPPGDAANFRWK